MPAASQVLLLGGGHGHLVVLRKVEALHRAACAVTLVDPGVFHYSGMATGLLGGRYRKEQLTIDLARLCRAKGVSFVAGSAVAVDRAARCVELADGQRLPYDWLSLNVGSVVEGEVAESIPIKPLPQLLELPAKLSSGPRQPRIAIVGAGVSGCEIAANLQVMSQKRQLDARLTLVDSAQSIARQLPGGARQHLHDCLLKRGIRVKLGSCVGSVVGGQLSLANGDTVDFDYLLWATGLAAPSWLSEIDGLRAGPRGVVINDQLQTDDSRIFAVGDCADLASVALPKIGVYGVRAGAVLAHNLLASATGAPLQAFDPQDKFLSILNLGDGTGLAWRGRHWWAGRLAMLLKDWIDQRFVSRHSASTIRS